jgi:hypothetical protein
MAAEPKDEGRADPKDEGRADPKDEGRADPKDEGRFGGAGRHAGAGGAFGGGTGFVVVAFISPVGLSVPDLAVRMLQGSGSIGERSPRPRATGRSAARAQELARKRSQELEKLKQIAQRASKERKKRNGGPAS